MSSEEMALELRKPPAKAEPWTGIQVGKAVNDGLGTTTVELAGHNFEVGDEVCISGLMVTVTSIADDGSGDPSGSFSYNGLASGDVNVGKMSSGEMALELRRKEAEDAFARSKAALDLQKVMESPDSPESPPRGAEKADKEEEERPRLAQGKGRGIGGTGWTTVKKEETNAEEPNPKEDAGNEEEEDEDDSAWF